MTKSLTFAGCSLAIALLLSATIAVVRAAENDDEAKPKHTIKEVMKQAHAASEGSKSLRDRVLAGNAKPEDKQQLLDLYISLAESKAPKGEQADYQKKTQPILLSAAKVVVGRDGALDELKAATNCAACHKDHKPPQK